MLKKLMIYLILFSSLMMNEKVDGEMIRKVGKSKTIKNQQILELIKQYKKIDDEIGLEFNEYIELANNEEISDIMKIIHSLNKKFL